MEAAGGVEIPDTGRATAVAFDFSTRESPTKVPRRIRRRLLECRNNSPSSVEEIEAKLKEADLRRRQFYQWLSNKARTKPRSLSGSSQEDPAHRLEAKLNAAQQKRLNLLASLQTRLSRMDELRQAAKFGVEMRFKKQRERLGSRVESQMQQAEANRMQFFEVLKQKQAAVQERKAKSLLQRTARETKYKECIRSAISQKRSAAERQRLLLLEAEKLRAQTKVMQARRIAKIVNCQREGERREMKEQMECRLQRAKRRRAEQLKVRSHTHNATARVNCAKLGDFLSRKLAWRWREFARSRRTTFALTQEYVALGINLNTARSMPFDQFANLIQSAATIHSTKALLDRFENRFFLYQTSCSSKPENIDHLLKSILSPIKKIPPGKKIRAVADKCSVRVLGADRLSRYPVRAVLCAYMILGHPKAVFSEQGEREVTLSKAAEAFIQEFELLIKVILEGATVSLMSKQPFPDFSSNALEVHQQSSRTSTAKTFRNQISVFDAVWHSYLYCFAVWKVKDARFLEDDLVRAACQLELSMMQTCKLTSEGEALNLSHDSRAIKKQVADDQNLIRQKVGHLSGKEGVSRMEYALTEMRSKFFEAKESVTHLVGHVAHLPLASSTSPVKSLDSVCKDFYIVKSEGSSHVARSLFGRAILQPLSSSQSSSASGHPPSENELLLNELVHNGQSNFSGALATKSRYGSIKAIFRETMEKAFWDEVMQSVSKCSSDFGRIIGLAKEVRDELIEIAPLSWKQEIQGSIDIDILSQVMELQIYDMDYFGRILEYALLTIRKLSALDDEDNLKKSHEKFLKDLASIAQSGCEKDSTISMIKGLRFALEQIWTLKNEISKTHIQMIEPMIKGPAGMDYLQKAFYDRYGPPSSAPATLTLTKLWLSPLKNLVDEEWNEYTDSLSLLLDNQALPPIASLRTGGKVHPAHMKPLYSDDAPDACDVLPGCTGEKLDVLVRIGLLRLANSTKGLIIDTIPETLKLNAIRLRSIQSQLQNIVVISTSVLVLRQIILSERLPFSLLELDTVISNSASSLSEVLDNVPEAGIVEIIEAMASFLTTEDNEKLQSRKQLMARTLTKSLETDNVVFQKVNRCIYSATQAFMFAGTGPNGRRLAHFTLQRVGSTVLLDRVLRASVVAIIMARVSVQVHGPWYQFLL